MIKKTGKNGVPYLTFPVLDEIDWIVNGFSTREGGVSKGDCATMNLSFTRGDDPDAVYENYERIGQAIGFTKEQIVTSHQTHTTNVRLVTKADAGKGITTQRDYTDVDGLITNEPGLALTTYYADCVPLYFVDKKNHAIGLSHSGWRGTVNKMGAKTLEAMKNAFGTNPSDVLACIGPSICQDCYEVSRDVADAFYEGFGQRAEELLIKKQFDKFQLDLWKANEFIFEEAGVPKEQITVGGICTCCNSDWLFSHRASHGKRGNLAAFLMIKY